MRKMDIYKSRFFAESWNVAYRKRQEGIPFEKSDETFIVIKNSFRYWAADPFLFEKDNETYIFAELYDYIEAKGVIGYLRLNDKNPRWIPVIREKYHLSFPFIYEENNEIYILPESNESKTLYRYRAVDFPGRWAKEEAIVKDVRLADTTPIKEHNNNLALTYDLADDSLKLIDLTQKNIKLLYPDKTGVRRPAGYINADKGIRAAQECLEDYGKGIILYHFELSWEQDYHEIEIKRIYPKNVVLSKKLYLDGMHTYNQSENYEVIDIKTRRFNILNFCMRLFRTVRRKCMNR